ncbi:hypothetical protein [Paenibacillus sp. CF384]|uniref:hypothetical protein n=1 Tax=Paenibacillus sp. CF384 TaxID=1884382 RepID=UPI0008970AFA|nr:hypothetical protein [Paenibacillus sp. CF384]SDW80789.1 hypothetical protein SAMN05518855_1005188 [Paenibacillus sp. CF384]
MREIARWLMSALIIVSCVVVVLSGCTKPSDIYGGISKTDFPELTEANLEYVYQYRGHADNWSAVLFVYKLKGADKFKMKEVLVYTGEDPKPTGQLSTEYTFGDAVGGSGMLIPEAPENGIYVMLPSLGTKELLPNTTAKLLVKWGAQSEYIELKSVPA